MADDKLDRLDYYTLLGLEPAADVATVRRAFRTFAVKYHPDRFATDAPENVERATAIYRRGSEALEVLTDPVARQAYDAGLARGELRLLDDPETAMRRAAIAARTAAAAAPSTHAHAGAHPHAAARAAPQHQTTHAAPRAHEVPLGHVPARPAGALHASPHAAAAPLPARAAAPAPAAGGVASLRTPQARAFAERARSAEAAGDVRAAWRALKAALEIEPGSAWLESEFHRVGGRLR